MHARIWCAHAQLPGAHPLKISAPGLCMRTHAQLPSTDPLIISAPGLASKIQEPIISQQLIFNELASCRRCDLMSQAHCQSRGTQGVELMECGQHEELNPMPSLRSVDRRSSDPKRKLGHGYDASGVDATPRLRARAVA